MFLPAIVTIGYNRAGSMERLLNSLARAEYPKDKSIPLIISIDNSGSDDVARVARAFSWEHGEKIIVERKERMGLKNHVLACGDFTREYGSIIVLEDDLVVSPAFYEYSIRALEFSDNDERIGSISLYNHLFNVHARKSFAALDDGYDNWYFQMSSSWGQAYTRKQWEDFLSWYEKNRQKPIVGADIPANIAGWSEKSWLKFFITYLVRTDKYCLYPRIGYTSNFGDIGSHAKKADTDLQIPLSFSRAPKFSFAGLDESRAVYDAYFENIRLDETYSEADYKPVKAIIDLYGSKPIDEIIAADSGIRYILTSRSLGLKVIKSFGRQMRPLDANIVCDVEGSDFYLYDVSEKAAAPGQSDEAESYLYEYRGISAKQMLKMIKYRILEKLQ